MKAAAHARGQKADPPQKRTEALSHPVHAPPAAASVPASLGRIQLQSTHRVSSPADPAEREAEATAKKIMHMALPTDAPPLQTGGTNGIQRRWIRSEAPRVARRADGTGAIGSGLTSQISGGGSGAPLPPAVRSFMEPRFQADFSNVRIHTGGEAAQLNRKLNAQAFALGNQIYFGKDKFQPDTHDGKELIAHELTHTIQQGAAIQGAGIVHRSVEARVGVRTAPRVQRLGIDDVVDYIADKANNIPGFRMLCVIIGKNPINKEPVPRTGANILRAIIGFIPGGELISKALDQYGILDKAGKWLEDQFAKLVALGQSIIDAFWKFIDSLGWRDALHPFRTWERAKRIFSEPIDRLIDFIKGLYDGFIAIIKAAILRPLAKLAEKTPAYDLLKAVLGKDPVTGEPYPSDPEHVIGGFMKLIHQEEIWENIKKANALPRAWKWFKDALKGLLNLVKQIPTMFLDALRSLELMDIVVLPRAFLKVGRAFGSFLKSFVSWAGSTIFSLLEIIFAVVAPGAMPYLNKAAEAFRTILKNPIGFVRNLVKAGKLGFDMFADNIGKHLRNSLIEWLTGSLPGVYIPQSFDFKEIVKFVLSVLGLTWANIRQKLVKVLGETAVKAMETGFDIVVTLVREGPAAAWEKIKEQLGNLKDMVMGAIVDYVVETVVKKAVAKVAMMLVPGAGFIGAIISIYDTIKVFIEKLSKIIQVAKAFLDSIIEISAGAIAGAAKKVENTLAGLLTLAISFLAGFAGLGKVADKVMEIINTKVRAPIDKALDMVIDWIVKAAKALFAKGKAAVGRIVGWWSEKLGFTNTAGESHTLQFIGEGDSAQLGVATTLTPVRTYLDTHPDKGTPDWDTADSVFTAAMRVIYSPAARNQAENERRAGIKRELAKVSAAFVRLGGAPPDAADYGTSTDPTYGNPAKVDVIVNKPKAGTRTGPWPTTKPGYKEIYDAGLTTATDPWVQMHIISEKLGGSGTDFDNLVPAPQSVNTGPFRSFEHATASLATGKSGPVKNRVWVEVLVSGAKNAATGLLGKAGLYFWKGKKATPKWLKNEEASLTASVGIPVPQLSSARKLVLNFTSGTEMVRDFGISSETARLVKEGRPYASQADFATSMTNRGATQTQVDAVLRRAPVLNGP